MKICYNKLQKLMIDNQMKRQDLMRAAEITSYAATKINKNEPVSLEVLMRICQVFHCDIGDICLMILILRITQKKFSLCSPARKFLWI